MISRLVGIEVEVESIGRSYREIVGAMCTSDWAVERDGSLRQDSGAAFEVKSASPVQAVALQPHLAQLYPALADSSGSWRAAVHVHVNVRDLSWNQRALALGLAYAADLPMFAKFSPERVQSNFCVPLSHKQAGVFECMAGMVSHHEITARYGKYSSVNVGRLGDLGTFEFRHLRTPKCGDSVADVTKALALIRSYALTCASIVHHAQAACRTRSTKCIGMGDALAGEFITLAETMQAAFASYTGSVPIELDRDAIGEAVTLFAGMQTYDPVDLDLPSLVRAAGMRRMSPRLRNIDTSELNEVPPHSLGVVFEQAADGSVVMRYRDSQPF